MVWREIAFERCNRMAWPIMVGKVNARMSMFPGMLAYDNTGLGSVVADYLDIPANCESVGIDMIGRRREVLFSEYISAIEGRHFLCPRIDYAYTEHRYAKSEDFYGSGHPPDSVVAGALAWHVRNEGRRISLPPLLVEEFARDRSPWRMT